MDERIAFACGSLTWYEVMARVISLGSTAVMFDSFGRKMLSDKS